VSAPDCFCARGTGTSAQAEGLCLSAFSFAHTASQFQVVTIPAIASQSRGTKIRGLLNFCHQSDDTWCATVKGKTGVTTELLHRVGDKISTAERPGGNGSNL
jgi:hypothetical protein